MRDAEGEPAAEVTAAPELSASTTDRNDLGAGAHALAFVAGLGFGTYALVWIPDIPSIAFLLFMAPLWVSSVNRRAIGLVGVWIALLSWPALWTGRPKVPWWEGSPMSGLLEGLIVYGLVLVALGYVAGLPARRLGGSKVMSRLSAVAAVPGVAMLVATAAPAMSVPATESFSLDLPAGWTVSPSRPQYWSAIWPYGQDFTAQYGTQAPLDRTAAPSRPVVGVSVTGGEDEQDAQGCFWMLSEYPLSWAADYRDLEDAPPAPNPLPDAYATARQDNAGTTYYIYSLARMRTLGIMTEQLCYLVVFTLPPDSPITEADVTAIFSTFRFR